MLSNFKLASISSATGKPFKAFAALLRDKYFYLSLSTVLFLFLLWVLLTATGYADELFLPGPVKVWQSFISVSTEGYQGSTLVTHVFTSLYRILVAFLLSCIVGIPLGILMGASKAARSLLNPLIEFYRPLPPLGLYTLLVMWLGIGEESKLGELLDPIADKILVASALVLLVMNGIIKNYEVIAAIVILTREILISGLREFLAKRKEASLPVSSLSKFKTFIQMLSIAMLLTGETGNKIINFQDYNAQTVGIILLWIAAFLTLYTGYDYLRKGIDSAINDDEKK